MKAGFTLIEMMVVITIFTIMTGVVLANLPQFRDKTFLDLTAQEVAITIRQAQVYGIGTKVAGGQFSSHGVNLTLTTADPKTMTLFADYLPSNNSYDVGENVEQFRINGAATFTRLESSDGSFCIPGPSCRLDIVFQRPYPEAEFKLNSLPEGGNVTITLTSTKTGKAREIQVWTTGQIIVRTV